MKRPSELFLIDWDAERGHRLADRLDEAGWQVALETADGGRAFKSIRDGHPAAVVIVASAKPSHGAQTARALHKTAATRDLPIVVVDADEDAEARFADVADCTFTTAENLSRTLNELKPGPETRKEETDEADED